MRPRVDTIGTHRPRCAEGDAALLSCVGLCVVGAVPGADIGDGVEGVSTKVGVVVGA